MSNFCQTVGCLSWEGIASYRTNPDQPLIDLCPTCAIRAGFTVGQKPVRAARFDADGRMAAGQVYKANRDRMNAKRKAQANNSQI